MSTKVLAEQETNGVKWKLLDKMGVHYIGMLPYWWNATGENPRPVTEQLNDAYAHGGGWRPLPGFVLEKGDYAHYKPRGVPSGDPPYKPLAVGEANGERVLVYDHSWVGVVKKDGTFEMNRMD